MRNKILMSRNCLEVQCDRTDTETQQLLTSIFPIHVNRIKTQYRMSTHNVPEILKLLRGIGVDNIDTAPPQVQEYFYKELAIRSNVEDLIENGPRNPYKVNEHLTLMRHQQLGREIAKYQDRYAFFYDTRTGKTPLSLAIMYDDIVANPSHKWLVVCPLILIDNAWIPDAAEFVRTL